MFKEVAHQVSSQMEIVWLKNGSLRPGKGLRKKVSSGDQPARRFELLFDQVTDLTKAIKPCGDSPHISENIFTKFEVN